MGIPVAVLEAGQNDSKAYVLIGPALSSSTHPARKGHVTCTRVFVIGIIPTKIEIKNAEGVWDEGSVATMM